MFQQLLRSCLCTSKYRIQELKRFYKWAAAASRKQANRSRGISAKKAKGAQSARQPSVPSRPACPLQTVVSLDGQSQSAMSVMTWQQKRDSVPNQATTLTPATPRILVLQHSSAFCLYWLSVGRAKVLVPASTSLSAIQQQSIMWFKLGYLFKALHFLKFPFVTDKDVCVCVCGWGWAEWESRYVGLSLDQHLVSGIFWGFAWGYVLKRHRGESLKCIFGDCLSNIWYRFDLGLIT